MLAFENVTFGYRRRSPVLAGVSVDLGPGVTVLLGPNGAGKSTLLSLGSGAVCPRSGKIKVGTLDSTVRGDRARFRAKVGWVPQQLDVIPSFTVREQTALAAWLKGATRSESWVEAEAAIAKVGLTAKLNRKASSLSGGQLRRMGIAEGLAHRAEVLLLDEPTAGLDAAQRSVFRELILNLRESSTIVIATHQTEDLAVLADRVIVMENGRFVFDDISTKFLSLAGADAGNANAAELAYRTLTEAEE
ncbi:ATP-binding cassette domain-containing protein [Nakamurella antarctica]|uniref:ATP-binding cassette domain-containing protein n=1 Tax=Nakamurella antarctica TaxID=1902245 RepID=A0A3G8ZIF6_9ACTN|nr:ATP-binding cassette domain-containing protein [Nakamurella antarctica]AZI57182.1 ATP-binding cassette domain-containing protein [Nakamurella antarctica]